MAGPAHDPFFFPPPSHPAAVAAAVNGTGNHNCWGPYHNAGDFSASMALVLLILVCTLAFVLAFVAAARFFLRRLCSRSPPSSSADSRAADLEKQEQAGKHAALDQAMPAAVAFTAGMELAGAAAECAICLAEFAEGEAVRVLPACNHGFHVKCIEAWLASKPSCPTCRCSCRVRKQPAPSDREAVTLTAGAETRGP